MRAMPYADNFFDAVACVWSLDVGIVNDIRTTINEIYRILRSNGTMVADFVSVDGKTYGQGGKGTS